MKKNKKSKADSLIYKALVKAINADKLRIYLDYAKINRPSSPIYNPWENLLPILVPVLIGLMFIILVGIIWGIVFIILMILIYSAYIKKIMHKKIIERTKHYITESYEKCEELWEFGGLVFVNKDNKKLGCVSPDGDWKEFVVINFADYMTNNENSEEKEQKDDKPKTSRRKHR